MMLSSLHSLYRPSCIVTLTLYRLFPLALLVSSLHSLHPAKSSLVCPSPHLLSSSPVLADLSHTLTALLFSLFSYSLHGDIELILAQATSVFVLLISVLSFILCILLPCLILLKHTTLTSSVQKRSGFCVSIISDTETWNKSTTTLTELALHSSKLHLHELSSNLCQP